MHKKFRGPTEKKMRLANEKARQRNLRLLRQGRTTVIGINRSSGLHKKVVNRQRQRLDEQ
jgi:hypothetical protein